MSMGNKKINIKFTVDEKKGLKKKSVDLIKQTPLFCHRNRH
jgi:hypothetical protein